MPQPFTLYRYRWVVLAVFMVVNLTIQTLWISYAPITGPAAHYYGVSDLQIGLFAMSFMVAFIPLSIPVSWVIDKYGFRVAVSTGAVMMGVFGIARGLAGANYALALAATVGIAASQPFLLNAWTKMPAQWFPNEERATAVGPRDAGEPRRDGIGHGPHAAPDRKNPHLRRSTGVRLHGRHLGRLVPRPRA